MENRILMNMHNNQSQRKAYDSHGIYSRNSYRH